MNWKAVEIADELATSINAETWNPELTVVRRYSPIRELQTSEKLEAVILPFETANQTLIDRRPHVKEDVTISINIQKGVRNPEDNSEIDPLTKVVQDISDFVRRLKQVDLSEGIAVFKGAEIAFDLAYLRDPVVFSGWTNLTYTVVRS